MIDLPEDILRYIIGFMPPCMLDHKSGISTVFRFHQSLCEIRSHCTLTSCLTHSSHDLANAVDMLNYCVAENARYAETSYFSSRAIHFLSSEARQIAYPKLSKLVEVSSICCDGRGVMFRRRL